MTHRERLTVPWWWWPLGIGLALTLVVAVGAFLGRNWALASTIVGVGLVAALLIGWGRARIEVDPTGLRAGGATLAPEFIERADAMDAAETSTWLRSHDGQRDWLLVRPWLHGAVRVVLRDPADPHPAWLLGTRSPEQLAAAVNGLTAERNEGNPHE